MTEINRLENELKKFGRNDYLTSSIIKGETIYTIRSERLKQALQDVVHSRASENEKLVILWVKTQLITQ